MILEDVLDAGPQRQKAKRRGRGPGSGNGKTAGRGHKGHYARAGGTRKPGFEGGQMPLFRRIPHRGFSNARFRGAPVPVVNLFDLDRFFEAGETVNLEAVRARGLVPQKSRSFKVLGAGEVTKALQVHAHGVSEQARQKIESVSGSVTLLEQSRKKKKNKAPGRHEAKK